MGTNGRNNALAGSYPLARLYPSKTNHCAGLAPTKVAIDDI